MGAGRTVYDSDWEAVRLVILERDAWRCQIRGAKCTLVATEVDHKIRPEDGGSRLGAHNLRASCRPCNASRGAKARARKLRVRLAQVDAATQRVW